MALRAFILSFLCVLFAAGAAYADDWRIVDVAGSARAFAAGAWAPLQAGAPLIPNAIVQTDGDGRLRLAGAGATLDAPADAKFRIDGDAAPLLRLFDGGLGVEASASLGVMTTYAYAETADAAFAVVAEPYGSTIAVTRGLVKVTDLTTRKTMLLRDGQILRLRAGQATLTLTAPVDQPAMATAASAAAGRLDAEGLNTKIALVDKTPTGALRPDAAASAIAALRDSAPNKNGAGSARLAEEAADAVHEERRKAKLGKADPRAVAAAARISRELFRDIDVDVEPWDDSFEWTEMEHGEKRLKPIWRVMLALGGAQSLEFWFLAFVSCLFLGAISNAIMEKSSFGLAGNTLLVMAAFAAALGLRDAFFRAGANLAIEPFLSIGMMLSAMTLILLSGAYAKLRLP
ncbi:MAG: hypothetical protein KGM15_11625 [Pseudomonadota bacterium]|nr:hypothetical protein [Pseudomonadota bacterium]